MKKVTYTPVFIVIASLLYFLIATAALAQEPVNNTTDSKQVKYCTSASNGKMSITASDGSEVKEPISFQNGATVSLDGIITWKDGSKTTLSAGDCVGVDILGAVYVAKAPVSEEKHDAGMTSNK
jgi:hypothetical protein